MCKKVMRAEDREGEAGDIDGVILLGLLIKFVELHGPLQYSSLDTTPTASSHISHIKTD